MFLLPGSTRGWEDPSKRLCRDARQRATDPFAPEHCARWRSEFEPSARRFAWSRKTECQRRKPTGPPCEDRSDPRPRSRRRDAFVRDYFIEEERAAFDDFAREEDRRRAIALVWSAKESALKAMRVGLRVDTRSVSVTHADKSISRAGWNSLRVRGPYSKIFYG